MDQGTQAILTQKLEIELAEMNNPFMPMAAIHDYLLTAAQDNDFLREMLMTKNRTLEHCASYVEKQVREALNNKNGYLPDAEVYGMAEDFYYLSDEDIANLINPPKKSTATKKNNPSTAASLLSKQEPVKAKPPVDPQLNLFDMLDTSVANNDNVDDELGDLSNAPNETSTQDMPHSIAS